jgi:hypothetical protein
MAAPPGALAPPPWALPHLGTPPALSWPQSSGLGGGDGWDGGGPPAFPGPPPPSTRPLPPPAPTTTTPSSSSSTPDALDLAVSYLKQRDGIDKLLKLVRYTCRLALVTGAVDPSSYPLSTKRLDALQASIGDARKAYRLGKFLQGIQAGRKAGGLTALSGALGTGPFLAALAGAGDAFYYFFEQGTWLVRAKAAPHAWGPPLARASAAAELVSYVGSAGLVLAALDGLALREVALCKAARAAAWEGREGDGRAAEADLADLRSRRSVLRAALAQDACDALLALADLRGGKSGGLLGSKPVLAGAGLASAVLGARKVWLATTAKGSGGGVKKNGLEK